jgi:RHS repeat-associated protein
VGQQTIADYGAGIAASTPRYRYVYASYIDEPVLRYEPSATETLYYHRNQQYSIIALTDNTGSITERYAYSAYGEPVFVSATGTVLADSAEDNRYTYTGREWDEGLGLYHFRARMYDAGSGRFLGRDPIGYADSINSYANVFCIAETDPSGLVTTELRELNCQGCGKAAVQWKVRDNDPRTVVIQKICVVINQTQCDHTSDECRYTCEFGKSDGCRLCYFEILVKSIFEDRVWENHYNDDNWKTAEYRNGTCGQRGSAHFTAWIRAFRHKDVKDLNFSQNKIDFPCGTNSIGARWAFDASANEDPSWWSNKHIKGSEAKSYADFNWNCCGPVKDHHSSGWAYNAYTGEGRPTDCSDSSPLPDPRLK